MLELIQVISLILMTIVNRSILLAIPKSMTKVPSFYNAACLITVADRYRHLITEHVLELIQVIRIVNNFIHLVTPTCVTKVLIYNAACSITVGVWYRHRIRHLLPKCAWKAATVGIPAKCAIVDLQLPAN